MAMPRDGKWICPAHRHPRRNPLTEPFDGTLSRHGTAHRHPLTEPFDGTLSRHGTAHRHPLREPFDGNLSRHGTAHRHFLREPFDGTLSRHGTAHRYPLTARTRIESAKNSYEGEVLLQVELLTYPETDAVRL